MSRLTQENTITNVVNDAEWMALDGESADGQTVGPMNQNFAQGLFLLTHAQVTVFKAEFVCAKNFLSEYKMTDVIIDRVYYCVSLSQIK